MGRSAFLAFVFAAAAFSPIAPASGSPEARDAEVAGPWSWEDFPKGDALLVAQVPVTIEPARMAVVRAPAAGRLRLEPALKPDGGVAEGACWAVIEPDDAAAAERELAEAEGRLKLRRENYRKWELPAALAAMDRQTADAGETLAVARLAERSPELFQGDHPALDPASRPALSSAQAEQQLKWIAERRQRTAAGEPDTEPADLQALQAAFEERRRDRDLRRAQLRLSADFAGRLQLARPEGASGSRVQMGEPVAVLVDDSALILRVRATPLLQAAAPESLFAEFTLPGGAVARADFLSQGVDLRADQPVPVLDFRVPAERLGAARRPTAGTELPGLVWVRLAEPARIVPKLALAERDSAGALARGWREGLETLFPGCRLVAEGAQAVAVKPPRD